MSCYRVLRGVRVVSYGAVLVRVTVVKPVRETCRSVSVRVNTWSVPCQSVLMMYVSIRVVSIRDDGVVRVNPCCVNPC